MSRIGKKPIQIPEGVKITINGLEVEAKEGQKILEVARQNGVVIPTFCYHERLKAIGSCRMCIVEVEGLKTLVQELITWKPDTRNPTDCVMALWFAIIRIRELMQQSSRVGQYQTNRWATRAQMSSRGSLNLDEAFAEQWAQTYG
jgi:ferredoxin